MAKSTSQIVVGANGSVFAAPVGTVAPVDVATAWIAAWVDLGYTNEDGVTFRDSQTTEPINVWQMFYPARFIVTGHETSASFVIRQWSKDTIVKAFGGGTVTTTAGPPAHYLYTPPTPGTIAEFALGVEWVDGSNIFRLVMPRVMVTEGIETNLTKASASDLPITVGVMGVDGATGFTIRTNSAAFA